MGWQDPSPLKRERPPLPSSLASAHPGGGVSFLRLMALVAVSLIVGGLVYEGVHALVVAWHVARRSGQPVLDLVVPLVVAAVVAFLVLRTLVRRPRAIGLSRRIRDGGGWLGRPSWARGHADSTYDAVIMADVAGDVVGAVVDAVVD